MIERKYNTIPQAFSPQFVEIKASENSVDNSEIARLLKLVYAPNPRTGLPSSDLSVLVSDSVPEDVANWVRTQLLNPLPDTSVSSVINNTQLDDDTIMALVRENGESDSMYIDRVDSLLRDWNNDNNNEGV